MKVTRIAFALSALACWAIMALLVLVVIPLGTFVVPMKIVPESKARGANELPVFWQLIVDANDCAKNRWFIVFPLLGLAGGAFTVQAIRRHTD
jgi:hypothetical protein